MKELGRKTGVLDKIVERAKHEYIATIWERGGKNIVF